MQTGRIVCDAQHITIGPDDQRPVRAVLVEELPERVARLADDVHETFIL